jgi:hypothetical protein
MNDALKNIFDQDSMNAILNAEQIIPTQKTAKRVGNIVYNDKIEEPEYIKEVEYVENEKIKEMQETLDSHANLIDKLIESQNELIKEINELKKRPVEKEVVVEKKSQDKPKQQNSTGNGLNPDDFSVEKTFYFGNK